MDDPVQRPAGFVLVDEVQLAVSSMTKMRLSLSTELSIRKYRWSFLSRFAGNAHDTP